MRAVRVNGSECPGCGERLDGICAPEGVEPQPGAFSICVNCAAILTIHNVGDVWTFSLVTADQFVDLPCEHRSQLRRAQEAVAMVRRRLREAREADE